MLERENLLWWTFYPGKVTIIKLIGYLFKYSFAKNVFGLTSLSPQDQKFEFLGPAPDLDISSIPFLLTGLKYVDHSNFNSGPLQVDFGPKDMRCPIIQFCTKINIAKFADIHTDGKK